MLLQTSKTFITESFDILHVVWSMLYGWYGETENNRGVMKDRRTLEQGVIWRKWRKYYHQGIVICDLNFITALVTFITSAKAFFIKRRDCDHTLKTVLRINFDR